MNGDAIEISAGRLGQRLPECVVPRVANANPIHGAKHDRLPRPQQHYATSLQRIFNRPRRDISHRLSDRGCDIRLERGDGQGSVSGREAAPAEDRDMRTIVSRKQNGRLVFFTRTAR